MGSLSPDIIAIDEETTCRPLTHVAMLDFIELSMVSEESEGVRDLMAVTSIDPKLMEVRIRL